MKILLGNAQFNFTDPDVCPHCHKGIEPKYATHASYYGNDNDIKVYTIWKCTFRDCQKLFVTAHIGTVFSSYLGTSQYIDGTTIYPHIPDSILKIESNFIETYKQALRADSLGLNEISGMGLRKALEYLVKDYIIFKNGEQKGKIENQLLSDVIKKNFKDEREIELQKLLLRASWLGNDETHYLKYHIDFNINDLKELIELVIDEIHLIEKKRHYIDNIQSKYDKKETKD